MATAKKLPSGSWRVQVYSYTDSNGKKHKESFTAYTKQEAELMAAEWQNKKDRHKKLDMTVEEAIQGYITAKTGVLSPSTLRGYTKMQKNNYTSIKNKKIRKLTTEDLQLFISSLSLDGQSPKSVRNIYGLLSSSIALYLPNTVFRVTLPAKTKKRPISPSDKDIQALYKEASPTLKKCIALAAFGSLRRGEICALTFADLNGNILHVSKDMVQDSNSKWVIKNIPKTSDSIRDVLLPQEVISLFNSESEPSEKLVEYANPASITCCFTKLRNRIGINVRFHDLRHYFASIGAVLQIPANYLENFGGWVQGGKVMREIYQNQITEKSKEYSQKMADHFSSVINGKNVPSKVHTDK